MCQVSSMAEYRESTKFPTSVIPPHSPSVGPWSPCAALLWDNQVLDMGQGVWIHKVLFVLHIISLDGETLTAMIYVEQKAQNWPGLIKKT